MLHSYTIDEIQTNGNPGVEYEIALFYRLLTIKPDEAARVMAAINNRSDDERIKDIISISDPVLIYNKLRENGLTLTDVSFETQNDAVGPADLVMYVKNTCGESKEIGLSVKNANTCTLNVTGRNFITETQINELKKELPHYTQMYITEMTEKFGNVENWFRKRKPSNNTDAFIDKIRDAVINNWPNVENKSTLLSALFQSDSPIEFWVVTYERRNYTIKTKPKTIAIQRAGDVTVKKMEKSYVAFYLDDIRIGHMQVKFNNGFVEKCTKDKPDVTVEKIKMSYGQPFSSWNFSVEKE